MERRGLLKALLAAPAAALLACVGGRKPPEPPTVATGGCDPGSPSGDWTATYTTSTGSFHCRGFNADAWTVTR